MTRREKRLTRIERAEAKLVRRYDEEVERQYFEWGPDALAVLVGALVESQNLTPEGAEFCEFGPLGDPLEWTLDFVEGLSMSEQQRLRALCYEYQAANEIA